MNINSETVSPASDIENLESGEPYVCRSRYELANGEEIDGYCLAYDATGHRIFDEKGNSHPLCTNADCSKEEALAFSSYKGLDVKDIFPIVFTLSLKIFGRNGEGKINAAL